MIARNAGSKIVGNAGILMSTQVATKILGTIFTIVVARRLGVEDYGLFIFASSLGYIFGMLAVFGFPKLITREVARGTHKTSEVLGNVIIIEIVLSILAVIAMLVTLKFLGYSGHRGLIVSVAGFAMILSALINVVAAFFRAHQRMELEAFMRFSLSFFNMGLGILVLLLGYGVLELAVSQAMIFSLILAVGLFLVFRNLARPSFSRRWSSYWDLMTVGWPFALSSIFIFAYSGMAVIILSILAGDRTTGLYSGAMNFIRVFGLLPAALVGAILPAMALSSKDASETWRTLYHRSLKYLLILALPITVGLFMLSERFVLLVLGNEYDESAQILRVAAWALILAFANHGLSNALISIDEEKAYLRIMGIAMVIGAGASLALIAIWGAYGAAMMTILVEALVLLTQLHVLSRAGQRIPLLQIALRPVLAVVVMATGIYIASDLGLAWVILIAAAIYATALFLFRTFEQDETEFMIALSWKWLARFRVSRIPTDHIPHGGTGS